MARMATGSELPDTMLPAQFFAHGGWSDTPEKRLMFAVMMDAIAQLQRGDAQGMSDAERWIQDESANVPIRFPDACDALGLEPTSFADGLMRWRTHFGILPRARRRVTPGGRLRSREKAPTEAAPMRCG